MFKNKRKTSVAVSIPVRSTKETLASQAFPLYSKKSLTSSLTKNKNGPSLEDLKQNFKNMLTPINLPYKKAKLNDCNGNEKGNWYFEWYYREPGTDDTFKRFRQSFDINRIKSKLGVAVAKNYGRIGVDYINQMLANGWNPHEYEQNTILSFNDQLANVKRKLLINASKNKIETFNCHTNRLYDFMRAKQLDYLLMLTFNLKHADLYRTYMLEEMKLSKKTINESLSYCSRIWKAAIKQGYAVNNPFTSVDRVTDNEVVRKRIDLYEPLTATELEIIFTRLKEIGEVNYSKFLLFIYYAFARTQEIARLKISSINLKGENPCIRFKGSGTKNKNGAFVQIVPPLLQILQSMELEKYPPDYYLFSGDGNGFAPGIKMLTKHRALVRWRKIVKLNLNIPKEMYGLKHTGNIDYLLNNKGAVDLKWQQMQNRHSSSSMTDRYNRKLGAYFIEVGQINFNVF